MVVTVIVRIICTLLGRLFADEFKAWVPRMVEWLIQVAAARVPEAYRERCAEEWRSHANEVPGEVGKLVHAIGALAASCRMRSLEPASRQSTADALRRLWTRRNLFETAGLVWATTIIAGVTMKELLNVQNSEPRIILAALTAAGLAFFAKLIVSERAKAARTSTAHTPKAREKEN